jgi:hypothetical protein
MDRLPHRIGSYIWLVRLDREKFNRQNSTDQENYSRKEQLSKRITRCPHEKDNHRERDNHREEDDRC